MTLWAIVPLKILSGSKQRLSGALSDEQRLQLTQAMAQDVLAVLKNCREIDHVLLVSGDAVAAELCAASGAQWLKPDSQRGLNADLAVACDYARQQGADACLILHADLPLLNSRSVDAMIVQARNTVEARQGKPLLAIVPCKQSTGSNLVYAPLPFPVPLVYGKDSYLLFQEQARQRGIACYTLSADDGDLDVDIPADLERLRQRINEADPSRARATRRVMAQIPPIAPLLT